MPAVARRKFHDRITGGNSAVELSDRSTARALIQPGFRLLRGSSDSLRRLLGGANAISRHLPTTERYAIRFERLSATRGRGALRASFGRPVFKPSRLGLRLGQPDIALGLAQRQVRPARKHGISRTEPPRSPPLLGAREGASRP